MLLTVIYGQLTYQSGQVPDTFISHGSTHGGWNLWSQGRTLTSSPARKSSVQIEHPRPSPLSSAGGAPVAGVADASLSCCIAVRLSWSVAARTSWSVTVIAGVMAGVITGAPADGGPAFPFGPPSSDLSWNSVCLSGSFGAGFYC